MQATRTPQLSSEDVDLDCFTRSEPPPESRPQRKRAWLAGITGLLLVTLTGVFLLGRSFASDGVRLNGAHGEAARAPAISTVATLSTPLAAAVPQKPCNASPIGDGARAKLSTYGKSAQKAPSSAKKASKHAAPKRALTR